MNQEPRVVLKFIKDTVDYRLVYDGATYVMQVRNTMYAPDAWQPTNHNFAALCEYVECLLLHASGLEEALTTAISIGSITVPQTVEPIMRSVPPGDDLHIVRVSDIEDSTYYDAPKLADFMWKRYKTGDSKYVGWSF